ncbi:MAG: hypothetical protein JWM11_6819 [Planctomycetaceae bacterium]|nr:hypothetical protein [Planctomycetaceae bacterium]
MWSRNCLLILVVTLTFVANSSADDDVRFVMKGHSGGATSVAFSPDGKILAAGCNDGSAKLWDLVSGKELRHWQAHDGTYCRVSFSPDGKTLATGCGTKFLGKSDLRIRLWSVPSGKEIGSLTGHQGGVNSIAFSPDGKLLLSGSNPILGGQPGEARLWNLVTLKEIESLKGHKDGVVAVSFSPDGKSFATAEGFFGNGIHVWETATRKEQFAVSGVSEFAFSPDGKELVGLRGNSVVFLNSSTGKENDAIANVDSSTYRMALSKDGKQLAISGKETPTAVWDINKAKQKAVIHDYFRDIVVGLAFSPDGKSLATGSLDTRVTIWDVEKLPKPVKK